MFEGRLCLFDERRYEISVFRKTHLYCDWSSEPLTNHRYFRFSPRHYSTASFQIPQDVLQKGIDRCRRQNENEHASDWNSWEKIATK